MPGEKDMDFALGQKKMLQRKVWLSKSIGFRLTKPSVKSSGKRCFLTKLEMGKKDMAFQAEGRGLSHSL